MGEKFSAGIFIAQRHRHPNPLNYPTQEKYYYIYQLSNVLQKIIDFRWDNRIFPPNGSASNQSAATG
jgi:hypothetical protein